MSSLKFLKKRIQSVKNTQKITRAMKMVSAAKLRRAQHRAEASRPYEMELEKIVGAISKETEWKSPYLISRDEIKKRAYVVVSTDRGLCGSLNTNVFKRVQKDTASEDPGSFDLICIGTKAKEFFRKRNYSIYSSYSEMMKRSSYEELEEIAQNLRNLFMNKDYDDIEIFYPEFVSTLIQRPKRVSLLPFQLETTAAPTAESNEHQKYYESFLLEPDGPELLRNLVPMLIDFRFYRVILESIASEHAARMSAMDSATNNARDMIGKLTLQKNRARQAAITKELMEIISGAEAL